MNKMGSYIKKTDEARTLRIGIGADGRRYGKASGRLGKQ